MQVMPGADIAAHAQKLEAEAKSRTYCDVNTDSWIIFFCLHIGSPPSPWC